MRLKRLVTGVVSVGMLGFAPLAVSAPAHADGLTFTPVITWDIHRMSSPYTGAAVAGQPYYVSGKITDASGVETPGASIARLQFRPNGSTTWRTLAIDSSPGYLFFDEDLRMTTRGTFRVQFDGYTAQSAWDDSFLPGTSMKAVAVMRKVTTRNPRGTLVTGKVAPSYQRKKLVFQRKQGGRWRKYTALRTSSTGTFRIKFPAPRRGRWYWRMLVAGDAQYVGSVVKLGYTYRTRPTHGRTSIGR